MKGSFFRVTLFVSAVAFSTVVIAETALTLKASKDTFGRSNERNRNNGASDTLLLSQYPYVRTIVAFDLSEVTNRIMSATFRFQQKSTVSQTLDLTIAPMVHTKNNANWGEGSGAAGIKGQNAKPGEACYGSSAFPEVQWEAASGTTVQDLNDKRLWQNPVASLKNLDWKEGVWIDTRISDIRLLENIRLSDYKTITLGLWGTTGNGFYEISSKESGNAPELVLVLEGK